MYILINDLMQNSDAPKKLLTPALADVWHGNDVTINFDKPERINCIGIGNADCTHFQVEMNSETLAEEYHGSGLYLFSPRKTYTANKIRIKHDGTFTGRIALGECFNMGISSSREPGFNTTSTSRRTLSGQIVEGAGGYAYRTLGVDVRYKLDHNFMDDIEKAYASQISKGFPFFLYFDDTTFVPWRRMYASLKDAKLIFQSSIRRGLYSKRFDFEEAF